MPTNVIGTPVNPSDELTALSVNFLYLVSRRELPNWPPL